MTDWTILLSGAAGAAAIKLLDGVVQWALGRLGKRGDRKLQKGKHCVDGLPVRKADILCASRTQYYDTRRAQHRQSIQRHTEIVHQLIPVSFAHQPDRENYEI